jgi:hypothetical protein
MNVSLVLFLSLVLLPGCCGPNRAVSDQVNKDAGTSEGRVLPRASADGVPDLSWLRGTWEILPKRSTVDAMQVANPQLQRLVQLKVYKIGSGRSSYDIENTNARPVGAEFFSSYMSVRGPTPITDLYPLVILSNNFVAGWPPRLTISFARDKRSDNLILGLKGARWVLRKVDASPGTPTQDWMRE